MIKHDKLIFCITFSCSAIFICFYRRFFRLLFDPLTEIKENMGDFGQFLQIVEEDGLHPYIGGLGTLVNVHMAIDVL